MLSENKSLPWSLSFVELFDENEHFPSMEILVGLLRSLDRKIIEEIMDAIEQSPIARENLAQEIDFWDD